jgi:hypothetical protein
MCAALSCSYVAAERCSEWRVRVKELTHTMEDPGSLASLLHEVDEANAALQVMCLLLFPLSVHKVCSAALLDKGIRGWI